ncbi:MAG: c-type cytochrome biogenesis protein CcmI [Gammaproteobacteria bacterium]
MTVFWIVAACFIIAALLFVLPPLLYRVDKDKKEVVEREVINTSIYRDQLAELERDLRNDMVEPEQYAQGRRELERRLLEDVTTQPGTAPLPVSVMPRSSRATAIVLGLALPLCAVLLYVKFGSPNALGPQPVASADATAAGQHSDAPEQIKAMIGKLIDRLKKNPQDPEGWAVLGRSLYALGRFDEATEAFSKSVAMVRTDAQLLADYADSMAMANGERLDEQSIALIREALKIDPNNQKALWLGGTADFEAGNFSSAVAHWERLLKLLPPNSDVSRTMAANIEEARGLASGKPPGMPAMSGNADAVPNDAGTAAPAATVSGMVNIAPALAAKSAPTDTVFIFARAAQGPRMPLAIMRAQVKDLPLSFTLDDSMAAMPTMKLSGVPEVVVGARISKSGDAMPRAGDLQGSSQVVKVGSSAVKVVIDSVVP